MIQLLTSFKISYPLSPTNSLPPTNLSPCLRAQPLVEYIWKESFILDCHVCSQAHTRNDASTLPLEDVTSIL
ncbi:MAG: hypothetical protein K9G11_00500 [Rickettsiaceae bacterium]|nr:hypothetical protein [Rickettsiaceae bacterium]